MKEEFLRVPLPFFFLSSLLEEADFFPFPFLKDIPDWFHSLYLFISRLNGGTIHAFCNGYTPDTMRATLEKNNKFIRIKAHKGEQEQKDQRNLGKQREMFVSWGKDMYFCSFVVNNISMQEI